MQISGSINIYQMRTNKRLAFNMRAQNTEKLIDTAVGMANNQEVYVNGFKVLLLDEKAQVKKHLLIFVFSSIVVV